MIIYIKKILIVIKREALFLGFHNRPKPLVHETAAFAGDRSTRRSKHERRRGAELDIYATRKSSRCGGKRQNGNRGSDRLG
jgi:hypothetical protein